MSNFDKNDSFSLTTFNDIQTILFGERTNPADSGLLGEVYNLKKRMKSDEEMKEYVSKLAKESVKKELTEFAHKEQEKIKALGSRLIKIITFICATIIPAYILLLNEFIK